MAKHLEIVQFKIFIIILAIVCRHFSSAFERENFVFWPNGTVPFYVNPAHFDKEQSLWILSSLQRFSSRSCVQFRPLLVAPSAEHVLVLENPRGVRRCELDMEGHSREEPHRVTVGYSCLRSPHLELLIMRALGFPFEHNRAMRDLYIDVQFENIQPDYIPFFTKEKILPPELRALPYDVDSVMHFGERDYSKNGHRSFIFKNPRTQQNRIGLSQTDLKKIEIIYGPECQKRDRQVKIDICKKYPSVRRKRETDQNDFDKVQNLRINRAITPPPETIGPTEKNKGDSKELNIDNELQDLIEQVYKITAKVIENERIIVCNNTHVNDTRKSDGVVSQVLTTSDENKGSNDIPSIIKIVVKHVEDAISNAKANISVFCDTAKSEELFQRAKCGWSSDSRCPTSFRSTTFGPVKHSTQHRPYIRQSTKHDGSGKKLQHASWFRAGNDTEEATNATKIRRKRNAELKSPTDISIATNNFNAMVKDNTTKVELNKNESHSFKPDDDSKEIEDKVYRNVTNLKVNNSKDILRIATKVFKDRKGEFASVRRNYREFGTSIKNKEHSYENRDSSSTSDREDRKRTPKRGVNVKERKRQRDKKQDRPQNKRLKTKRGKSRSHLPETVALSKGNKEFYAERIWPDGVVRYVITQDSTYNLQDMRARLAEVDGILKSKTCVRIEEVSEEEGQTYKDYLVLDTSADYVTGRVGGRQNFGSIELFEGGQHRQHAAMMVMAMLGFYFELSRHDRDQYVRVHNRHIRPDKLHHFEKIRSDATLSVPYDYASATHPAWQFWRRVGRTGISTVATYKDQDPDGSIMRSLGQNEKLLSDIDLIKINSIYGVQCFRNKNIDYEEI